MSSAAPACPRRGERGAAAVEFALVVPILLALVFGIIDYGLWFSDSIGVRQGVREAARQATVGSFGTTASCGATYASTPSPDIQRLVCTTKNRTDSVSGPTFVKVVLPAGWVKGQPLVVCAMVAARGLTGLTPLPAGGFVKGRVEMAVEKAAPGQVETGGSEVAPAGGEWSWC